MFDCVRYPIGRRAVYHRPERLLAGIFEETARGRRAG